MIATGSNARFSFLRLFQLLRFKSLRWGLMLWLLFILPAEALELRVAIKKGVKRVKVGSSTPALVRNAAGQTLGTLSNLDAYAAVPKGASVGIGSWQSNQLIIEPQDDGYVWIGNRWYRGRTRLIRQGSGVTALNLVDLENYLYSVVGSESIPTWPQDALRAQAVAARTYALYQISKSSNRYYDLDTTTATQVYKGLEKEFLSTQEAVNNTTGQILTHNGKAILAAFHSSSGGHTENVEDVWMRPLPYLRGVVDYDQLSPVFQWNKTFSAGQLGKLIGGVGSVRNLIVERRTPRGRVVSLKVIGTRRSKQIRGAQLRKALNLRSTLFSVYPRSGKFVISGRGYGHGIGLSQWGSQYLAEQGVDYQRILSHYYQTAQISLMGQASGAPEAKLALRQTDID